jgi:transcriptional regulator of acetoin/glycerol metabolism
VSIESSRSSDLSDYPLAKAYGWVPHPEGQVGIGPRVIWKPPASSPVTRETITRALKTSRTKAEAAKALGINRTDLYRRCKRFGIEIVGRGASWAMHGV